MGTLSLVLLSGVVSYQRGVTSVILISLNLNVFLEILFLVA